MADKNMNAKINVDFEESTSRQSLNSGDSLPTLFGKIKKFFSDLKTVCFSGSYNDLSDKPTTATTDTDGLMSAEDKGKLDSIDDTYALKSLYGDTTINIGRKAETKVGNYSTAEGNNTTASSWASHAEGDGTTASGDYSHAEGKSTAASGLYSHAEGGSTTASGNNSHAEGRSTIASNYTSHAEGNATTASGNSSHAEGQLTTASGFYSHAEGNNTTASGDSSHAEGYSSYKVTQLITDFLNGNITKDDIINTWKTKKFSVAHGNESHVEGQDNLSLGHYSHTEGLYTVAIGNQSHTSGYYTKALHDNEAAYGKYNESNDNTLFSVGDGTADDARHNAFEITTDGGKLHDKDIATTDLIPTSLPANGGNADIAHKVISPSSKVSLYENEEGGNLELVAPDGVHLMQMDLYNNEYFRMYFYDGSQEYFPVVFNFSTGKFNINGDAGNADTLDGLHADDFAKSTSPRINGDMVFLSDTNQNTINAIYSANDNLVLRNISKDGSSICDVVIGNDGVRIANATQNFIVGNGGNADTVDGFHADDFAKSYNDYLGTYLAGKSGDIRELAHLLPTGGLLANTGYPEFQNITFPISGDILITWNKSKFSRNGLIYGTLTIQSMTSTGDICICSVYNTTAYTDWQKIYTDWNKPYVTGIATNVVDGVIHPNTYYSYHGFMPSAVFYIVPGQMTNQHDMIYSAKSFDTEKFTAPSMTNGAGNTLTQIKYIMFK